ncbi:hypothetical protein NIES4071_106070 (plasmid) [Calothrix sp. NIES-4071]|nr:hypothetical protein NIES4071_106070 [Calothrix sp. NIES-4071]BAZ65025.1 hypothetical protein NIES4105_107580 [Calothrix sp. NIES-4105]
MPKNVRSLNPSSKTKWKAPPDDKPAIFVRGELDDYGLNLYEFRVLAHVARRESKESGCYESQAKMATACGMSQRMVLKVLQVLCEAGILSKEKADGKRTNSYRVNKGSKWMHPSCLESIRSKKSVLDSE